MTSARIWVGVGMSALLAAAACRQPAEQPPVDAPAPAPTPAVTEPATLGRAEMVAALALAASAYAAGAPASDGPMLAGRTFSIRLPFGCFGPADAGSPQGMALAGDGLAGWRWSGDRRTQTLSLTPLDWTRSALVVPAGIEPDWERVDGFWIARPWLAADTCPAPSPAAVAPVAAQTSGDDAADAAPPTAAPASPFTAGLAAIRPEGGSRLGRRDGQAYSFVVRAADGQAAAAPTDGYRLVLQGRVATFPDGHAVRCSASSPNRRPTCIAAVVLDGVAFETSTGERVSEWRPEG